MQKYRKTLKTKAPMAPNPMKTPTQSNHVIYPLLEPFINIFSQPRAYCIRQRPIELDWTLSPSPPSPCPVDFVPGI